ncbi:MarR family winged helix-turn-helix transcriptional regulator [Paenibacillus monticola]|uniref:MarR family transcriptional regulator n=1 Tax=Paenibacillus monticola TaxID=2666075 RepID=A0A7X2HAU7_9BACL|nr:MarR family transcriptional regulator [Paenibacillus monticola]MRN56013.1 MarR family transcriptional regulator [Paenibacillus monticola]
MMIDDKYENIDSLIEAFQQFSKMNWRTTTLWGLKPSEIRLLVSIKLGVEREGKKAQTVSDLSKLLKVTSPTITQMVNSLITQGYVVRTTDTQDRRISDITLTDKGEHLAEMAVTRGRDTFKGMIDHLGKEQSDTLMQLLNEVYSYFEEVSRQHNDF